MNNKPFFRDLQERWDSYGAQLTDDLWRLDNCLQQCDSFAVSRDQMFKWLQDVDKSMEQQKPLRGTLQEKKVQRQNQKVSIYICMYANRDLHWSFIYFFTL